MNEAEPIQRSEKFNEFAEAVGQLIYAAGEEMHSPVQTSQDVCDLLFDTTDGDASKVTPEMIVVAFRELGV